jgi:ABC-type nickel/cobalt efflux system permease component RcnA
MDRLAAVLLAFVLLARPAVAHPVPKENHDRTALVRLTPAGVRVAIRFEVDETMAALDLSRAKFPGLGRLTTRDQIPELYADYLAGRLPELFQAEIGAVLLPLRVVSKSGRVTDHIRCEFALEAAWPATRRGQEPFIFRDTGWENDEASKVALYLDAGTGIALLTAEVPDAALIARKSSDWGPGDRERRRTLRATFTEQPREPPGRYRPGPPPDPEPEKSVDSSGVALPPPLAGVVVAEAISSPGWASSKREDDTPSLPDVPTAPRKPTATLGRLLFDSNVGLGMLLLLAGLFGAAHALTPGHGKTMVAAYLVGERGTIGHAILLGIVTTLTHTAAVLILAALLPFLIGREQNVQTALEFLGGLLIAGMGIFLLLRRVAGQSDHVHLFGEHSHGPVAEGTSVRWIDLILLGVAGGIVPCWDAIAMLGLAIASGRMWLGLPLLLAFSAGLAFVLVAVGIGVVLARKVARPHLERHRDRLEVVGKVLPLITAVVITILGLWLCYDALHGGHDQDMPADSST